MESLKQFLFGTQIGLAIAMGLVFVILGVSGLMLFVGPYFRIIGGFLLLIGTANIYAATARYFLRRYEF